MATVDQSSMRGLVDTSHRGMRRRLPDFIDQARFEIAKGKRIMIICAAEFVAAFRTALPALAAVPGKPWLHYLFCKRSCRRQALRVVWRGNGVLVRQLGVIARFAQNASLRAV